MKNLTGIISIQLLILLFWGCQNEPMAPISVEQTQSVASFLTKPAMGYGQLKVMNWNIYVGADVDIVLSATDPLDMAIKVMA